MYYLTIVNFDVFKFAMECLLYATVAKTTRYVRLGVPISAVMNINAE